MRKILFAALILALLVPGIAEAGKHKHKDKDTHGHPEVTAQHFNYPQPVTVYDFTSSRWRGIVQYEVNDYNNRRPPGSRYLIYSGQGYKPCSQNPGPDRVGVVVCSQGMIGGSWGCPGCGFTSWYYGANGSVRRALIEIEDSQETLNIGYAVACHEMVHAIGIVYDGPRDQDSCMRGPRWNYGSFDLYWMSHRLANP